jgi:transcription-repair coupling factor (superfamily II helicase)
VVLSFHRNTFANPAGLVRWLASRGGAVRLRPDHRLALARDLAAGERLRVAGKLVAELNRLVRGERAA